MFFCAKRLNFTHSSHAGYTTKKPAPEGADLIRNILGNVFQSALQGGAKLAQGFCLDILIVFQSADGLSVDPAFFPEPVCGNILFLHHCPQFVKYDHSYPPILTFFIMGFIILIVKGI